MNYPRGISSEPTYAELKALSDEDLVRRHDELARHVTIGTRFYLDELVRREQGRQAQAMLESAKRVEDLTERMERATRTVQRLTGAMTIITAAAATAAVVSVVFTGMQVFG